MANRKTTRKPLFDWTQGLTQSAIESWLACPEQFSMNYIEGWTPTAFSVPLEFGTLFHSMLDRQGTKDATIIAREVTQSYYKTRRAVLKSAEDLNALDETLCSVEALFPMYAANWAKEDKKINWTQREKMFEVQHEFGPRLPGLPVDTKVTLRGKRDAEFSLPKKETGLFETKTKSQIDDVAIQAALRFDFQTMFYALSMYLEYGKCPSQVLYNVVRRPQLRRKKEETLAQFSARIQKDIKDRPDWYFRRWHVDFTFDDLLIFINNVLNPTLRVMLQWWESIAGNPFDRWSSPYHFVCLQSLYNKYGRAALFNLIVLGQTRQYYHRSSLFPELDPV